MKTKLVILGLAGALLALAAWFVHEPSEAPSAAAAGLEDESNPGYEVPEKYRDTVHKGLEYLARNQCADGHWEGDGGKHPAAMTGLVGLALLMEKDSPRSNGDRTGLSFVREAHYTTHIGKAVDWLLAKSQAARGGLIFSEHPSETARYMEGHGLATVFLAGVSMDEDVGVQKKLNEVLARAVQYIVSAQSTQGGWYHTSRVEGHDLDAISATVIQIQALQAAENAGVPVPSRTMHDAQVHLKLALETYANGANAGRSRSRPLDTAAALVCWGRGLHSKSDDEVYKNWWTYCGGAISTGRDMKFGRDELAHYYFAQAMFEHSSMRRPRSKFAGAWSGYRKVLFDHLQSSQNKDGGWPASEGISVGPVYATALWCTVLQLDRDRHPSRQRETEKVK